MLIFSRPSRPSCRDGKKLRPARGAQQATPCAGLLRINTTSGFAAPRHADTGNSAISKCARIILRARIGTARPPQRNFRWRGQAGLSGFLILFAILVGLGQVGSSQMEERRRFPRTEMNEPAFVSAGGSVMRCTLLNMSAEGCAIEVNEPAFVPQRFRLVLASDSSIVRDCQIAWIQQNRIGVTFVSVPQARIPAADEPTSA
jgi:PilZ domain-containing protein